ncbi:cation:proton antiporter [Candidatus Woesearchaeota archaeon]|nr:cation:proton antiporter [Candidatus Woesearchaeota archaeon]
MNYAFADSGKVTSNHNYGLTFFWIAVLLLAAKISGLVERLGQPSVLGEILIGILLGNLALLGVSVFEPIKTDPFIAFLAEFGIVLLLFHVGLESSIHEMKKVGWRALLVACIGVAVPFLLATLVVGPLLFPESSFQVYLFLGATLTATSVSITARVFKDLGKLTMKEAQIVLGAAVIDDVLGLIILAVVSAIVTSGAVSLLQISWITLKAVLFLAGAILLGSFFASLLGQGFSKIHTGIGMKLTLTIAFGLIISYIAQLIGLAPLVGAFAAGLILEPVHFRYFREPEIVEEIKKEHLKAERAKTESPSVSGMSEVSGMSGGLYAIIQKHADRHIIDLIEPITLIFVPLFFVMTGVVVDLTVLFDLKILLIALGVTLVAVLGKLCAGLAAGNVNKWLVGWGMVPRGEVGLIFATIGKGLGVINDQVYAIIVIMIVISTLITPPILHYLLKHMPNNRV